MSLNLVGFILVIITSIIERVCWRHTKKTEEQNTNTIYKIKVLPTIIVFNKTEEIKRFKGNLMFQLDVEKQEIQAVIDSIIISKFR